MEKLLYHQQSSVLHASGVSQAITLQLLTTLGFPGFYEHGRTVSSFYKNRKEFFEALVRKHLAPLGVTWNEPEAGMFYWLDLANTNIAGKEEFDTKELIKEKAIAEGVLLIPVYKLSVFGTNH